MAVVGQAVESERARSVTAGGASVWTRWPVVVDRGGTYEIWARGTIISSHSGFAAAKAAAGTGPTALRVEQLYPLTIPQLVVNDATCRLTDNWQVDGQPRQPLVADLSTQ